MDFDCTKQEFRVFESLVEDNDFVGSFLFYLELVLLGVKPATCPSMPRELEVFRDEIKEMGLYFKRISLEFVDFDQLPDYMEEEEYDKPYFVARNSERLDMLKDRYLDEEEYDRDFGVFLGYPEEDVKWFVQEGEDQYEKSKNKLRDPEDFEEVVRKTMYVPKPTEKCFERAKETAEKYIRAIQKADQEFGSNVGKKLIERHCNR